MESHIWSCSLLQLLSALGTFCPKYGDDCIVKRLKSIVAETPKTIRKTFEAKPKAIAGSPIDISSIDIQFTIMEMENGNVSIESVSGLTGVYHIRELYLFAPEGAAMTRVTHSAHIKSPLGVVNLETVMRNSHIMLHALENHVQSVAAACCERDEVAIHQQKERQQEQDKPAVSNNLIQLLRKAQQYKKKSDSIS